MLQDRISDYELALKYAGKLLAAGLRADPIAQKIAGTTVRLSIGSYFTIEWQIGDSLTHQPDGPENGTEHD